MFIGGVQVCASRALWSVRGHRCLVQRGVTRVMWSPLVRRRALTLTEAPVARARGAGLPAAGRPSCLPGFVSRCLVPEHVSTAIGVDPVCQRVIRFQPSPGVLSGCPTHPLLPLLLLPLFLHLFLLHLPSHLLSLSGEFVFTCLTRVHRFHFCRIF